MIAVIMAGGGGTRFWPRSRREEPKQFLPLLGKKTLLAETVARVRPLIGPERIVVVTSARFVGRVHRELPELPVANILGEPVGRNTAPCIALAAALADRRWGGSEVMAVLPADHHIGEADRFLALLSAAGEACRSERILVTLGIKPTRPETGYGYLEVGEAWKDVGGVRVYRLGRFVEKPDRKKAEEFVRSGKHFWNSGMFLWRVDAIEEELEKHLPELSGPMRAFREAKNSQLQALLEKHYPAMPSVSIDYGVMEKAENVVALPAEFGWSDVGSWEALGDLIAHDDHENAVIGDHLGIDSRRCIVHSPGRLVVTIGMEDVIVVQTDEAILVCPRSRAQEVRAVVDRLHEEGLDHLL